MTALDFCDWGRHCDWTHAHTPASVACVLLSGLEFDFHPTVVDKKLKGNMQDVSRMRIAQ